MVLRLELALEGELDVMVQVKSFMSMKVPTKIEM